MADFYKVDLDVLAQMSKTLRDAGNEMDQALQALGGHEAGAVGPGVLTQAANGFQSTWKYGLGQLKQAIGECTDGVDMVHKTYEDTEQGVSQALGKITNLLQEQGEYSLCHSTPYSTPPTRIRARIRTLDSIRRRAYPRT